LWTALLNAYGRSSPRTNMISKNRCPHTRVVNFFVKSDPLLAVGSISEIATPAQYAWRCYLDNEASGVASNATLAETKLRKAIASRLFEGSRSQAA
jgi:hypothetical protein